METSNLSMRMSLEAYSPYTSPQRRIIVTCSIEKWDEVIQLVVLLYFLFVRLARRNAFPTADVTSIMKSLNSHMAAPPCKLLVWKSNFKISRMG